MRSQSAQLGKLPPETPLIGLRAEALRLRERRVGGWAAPRHTNSEGTKHSFGVLFVSSILSSSNDDRENLFSICIGILAISTFRP
jgi:hypothetical protein